MDAIDRSIRDRLQRAGEEMSARPLRREGATAAPASRRTLRPLMAAVALAVVVGVVAGGVGLHSRPSGRHGAPATTPPPGAPTPALSTAAPAPTPQTAPYLAAYGNLSAVWDSTHQQVVLYAGGSGKTDTTGTVWTWRGTWRQVTPATGVTPDVNGPGALADAPGLHGLALIGAGSGLGGNWLWDGSKWTRLPTQKSDYCMDPAQAVWDSRRNQLVVVLVDMCSGGNVIIPPQTWTYDGHAWQRHADLPSDPTTRGVVAWDPELKNLVLIGGYRNGTRAWTWSGTAWTPGPSSSLGFIGGTAGWDARLGALVVWSRDYAADGSTQASAVAFRKGSFRALPQAAAMDSIGAVFADTTDGRLLAIAGEPVPIGATPPPYHYGAASPDQFLLVWTGTTWTHVEHLDFLRAP